MSSRWDRLLDQKPRPLVDHLLEEVARLIVRDLKPWPMTVESLDPQTGQGFAPLLEPGAPRPQRAVYFEAFRVARWELLREVAAQDEYMRNLRYLEHGLAPSDKRALLFLSRWLVEQLLGLLEATENRISRQQLVTCLESAERLLLAGSPRG